MADVAGNIPNDEQGSSFGRIFAAIGNHKDVLLAVGILAVLGLLVLPLNPFLLDLFLGLSLSISILVLMVSVYLKLLELRFELELLVELFPQSKFVKGFVFEFA